MWKDRYNSHTNHPEMPRITRVIVGNILSNLDFRKKASRKNDICLPLFPVHFPVYSYMSNIYLNINIEYLPFYGGGNCGSHVLFHVTDL